MTAATDGERGAGMHIGYAISECALGRLLVAATDRGVCFVGLGDSDLELAQALCQEYPNAEVNRRDSGLAGVVRRVVALLDGHACDFALPLDLRATAFQRLVWDTLRRVPAGHTVSYAGLARRVGRPRAVRAVAAVVARNPVAVLIPCHRVVRSDGTVGGYRWGVERKRRLLQMERGGGMDHGE